MTKVKWGVLGTANIAYGQTIPGMLEADNCELYAVAGRSLEKAEQFKEKFGFTKAYGSYEELLADADVEAVYVPLPNTLHLPWVKKALQAGKNVLCEKPAGMNAEEVREMFKVARENNVLLMEAFAYLHSPYVESLKKDIASGIIGDVDFLETAFYTQGYKDDIRIRKETGGGAIYDLGCYCSSLILSLVDSDPVYVKANAEFSDKDIDLLTSGIAKFENGIRAAFNVGMILGDEDFFRFDRLYIHGPKGKILSGTEYNQAGDISYDIITDDGVITRKMTARSNYALEIEQFGRCVKGEEEPHITEAFSLRNSEFLDKVLEEIGY